MSNQVSNLYRQLPPLARKSLKLFLTLSLVLIIVDITVYLSLKLAVTSDVSTVESVLRVIQPFTDSDIERSVPAWFNGSLWFLASAIAMFIAHVRSSKAWVGFGVICALLSLDEIISLHESLGGQAQNLVGNQTGLLNFEWVILGAVLGLGLAIAGYRAVKTLNKNLRQLIFIAGLVFVSGALMFESFSGYAIENYGTQLFYHSMAWIEEFLEMAGVSLLLAALISASGIDRVRFNSL